MDLHKIIVRRSTTICLTFVFACACCLHCAMVLMASLTSRSFKCSFWMSSWAGLKLRVCSIVSTSVISFCMCVFLRRRVGFCFTLFVHWLLFFFYFLVVAAFACPFSFICLRFVLCMILYAGDEENVNKEIKND